MKRFEAMRNALLTALAWVGLLLYVLACASWSPDGSTLLYPYHNPETGESGVAIYERGSDVAKILYTSNEELTPVQWAREGKRALLFVEDRELLVLPLDDSGPMLRVKLPVEASDNCFFPIPEVDGKLFLSGDSLARVDLQSGETFVREDPPTGGIIFFQGKEEVHYTRGLEGGVEIGRLDLETLALEPDFVLSAELLAEHGIDELGYFTFDPKSERIGAVAVGDGIAGIVLLGRDGLERVVVPRTTETTYALEHLQWSPDGTRIYIAMASPREDGESIQAFVAEVSLDDGATRVLPIARLTKNWDPGSVSLFPLQLALSPDGNLIAVSTAALEENDIALEDRGLYLFDLRDFGSYVSFIPLPESTSKVDGEERS